MAKEPQKQAPVQQILPLNRPKHVQAILQIGHDKYHSLVRQGALRVSRPSGRLTYVTAADLQAFIENGFPK